MSAAKPELDVLVPTCDRPGRGRRDPAVGAYHLESPATVRDRTPQARDVVGSAP
jgi:hypothetical protein